ncbi:unnamed protein product, partial [Prorocentrum cordatum]
GEQQHELHVYSAGQWCFEHRVCEQPDRQCEDPCFNRGLFELYDLLCFLINLDPYDPGLHMLVALGLRAPAVALPSALTLPFPISCMNAVLELGMLEGGGWDQGARDPGRATSGLAGGSSAADARPALSAAEFEALEAMSTFPTQVPPAQAHGAAVGATSPGLNVQDISRLVANEIQTHTATITAQVQTVVTNTMVAVQGTIVSQLQQHFEPTAPKQIRREQQSKRLAAICAEKVPNLTWSAIRPRGLVQADGQPVVEVGVRGATEPSRLLWNQVVVAQLNIDREAIDSAFLRAYAGYSSDSTFADMVKKFVFSTFTIMIFPLIIVSVFVGIPDFVFRSRHYPEVLHEYMSCVNWDAMGSYDRWALTKLWWTVLPNPWMEMVQLLVKAPGWLEILLTWLLLCLIIGLFTSRIVELDAAARRAGGHEDAAERMPCFLSYDVQAAFPSMNWQWIAAVLLHHCLPAGYICAIWALYHDLQVSAWFGDEFRYLFQVSAGVAQGCPLSGTLWALCFDAFLFHIAEGIDASEPPCDHLDAGACADDVG